MTSTPPSPDEPTRQEKLTNSWRVSLNIWVDRFRKSQVALRAAEDDLAAVEHDLRELLMQHYSADTEPTQRELYELIQKHFGSPGQAVRSDHEHSHG